MRKLDEKREVLYVIRAMDVLMSSGIGLEATVHSISQGGYGVISEDFAKMMENVRKGGRPLEKELKSLMKNVETEGYRRLLNIMHMNITQNTDIIETLKKQGTRMEEERTEDVKKYIKAGADGVIVGSAFLKLIEKTPQNKLESKIASFTKSLKKQTLQKK